MKQLTLNEIRFVNAFVRYGNLSRAIRLAFPDDAPNWSQKYQHLKGKRLMEKDSIKTEIADRQAIKEANATLASQRIQKIIKEGKDQHALGASIFSIEQVDGKAKQVIQQHSKHTLVTYDLSGGTAGDVPQHILDALEGE